MNSVPPPALRLLRVLLLFGIALSLAACKSTHVRTTVDFKDSFALDGRTLVMVEPSIQLYQMQASGVLEPKAEWTRLARKYFSVAVSDFLTQNNAKLAPDYFPDAKLPSEHRIRQVLALNYAVMGTIYQHSYLHVPLPTRGTKRRKPLSWTVGPGVQEIRKVTGADYMLTLDIFDAYTSKGRAAMMVLGVALQLGILQGGSQRGIATLVDLETGDVVWFNVMTDQLGDLRDQEGATVTAHRLLKGLPL